MTDNYPGLPHEHPVPAYLHRIETDLRRFAATSMHPANVEAIVVAEWFTAALDDELPVNVSNYCADIAVMRARVRDMQRKHRAKEETKIAADVIATDYASRHPVPADPSSLMKDE